MSVGSSTLEDVCGDVSGGSVWDIVGASTTPAGYTYFDGTNPWFRMRFGDAPYSGSGGAAAGLVLAGLALARRRRR